jgi:hypothetical protein
MKQSYVGQKLITAWPEAKPREPGAEAESGYAVKYADGYTSWSPKAAFEEAYRPLDHLDFAGALFMLKAGMRLRRAGWKTPCWVVMMPGLKLPPFSSQEPGAKVNDRTARHIGVNMPLDSQPYFALFIVVAGLWQPGWTPSIMDLLADDWQVLSDL